MKRSAKKDLSQYKLSDTTIDKLGYYVYLLLDPRIKESTKSVFYVGKGCGNRINHQLLGAVEEKTKETDKIKTIREIHASGKEVDLKILRHGLSEIEAFEIECAVIDLLGIKNLTNLVAGHDSALRGIKRLSDLKIEYEPVDAVFTEPVVLININKKYYPEMSVEEMYEATRGNWKIGERAKKIGTVCAVYRGIIREVFEVTSWNQSEEKGRLYFEGKVASNSVRDMYIHTSVSKFWKQGSQNPIKYV